MKMIVAPYKKFSESAKLLAQALGCKRMKLDGKSRFKDGVVINWGNQNFPLHERSYLLNPQYAVTRAINKGVTLVAIDERLNMFFKNRNIYTVPHTYHKEKALEWINTGHTVYCRKTVTGSGGAGIVIATKPEELVDAKLYTQGITKAREYRIFVALWLDNPVFLVYQKKRRDKEVDGKIKNHDNGWVFCENNITPLPEMNVGFEEILRALELCFGAIDILVKNKTIYVLEVNTAPGMTEHTAAKFAEAFRSPRLEEWLEL